MTIARGGALSPQPEQHRACVALVHTTSQQEVLLSVLGRLRPEARSVVVIDNRIGLKTWLTPEAAPGKCAATPKGEHFHERLVLPDATAPTGRHVGLCA